MTVAYWSYNELSALDLGQIILLNVSTELPTNNYNILKMESRVVIVNKGVDILHKVK